MGKDKMIRYPFKPVDIGFSITGFHTAYEFRWDENYIHLGEQHDFWEIVYVISGEVEVAEDERVYRLRDRNMIFHAPMEFHKIRSLPGSSPHILILTFSADGNLPEQVKNGIFNISHSDHHLFHNIVNEALQFLRIDNFDTLPIKFASLELTSFILKLTSSQTAKNKLSLTRSATEYHNIVVAMSEGLHSNLTLTDIAERCHISISYIKTLFARYSGISPKTYYANMRFNEAVRLLDEGFSVNEVSEIMNFSSPNYFSVFFKNQCGMPPAKYMKNK